MKHVVFAKSGVVIPFVNSDGNNCMVNAKLVIIRGIPQPYKAYFLNFRSLNPAILLSFIVVHYAFILSFIVVRYAFILSLQDFH